MLNSSVASRPAYNRIAFSPPDWSGRNFVTSSTCPSKTTQMSSFLLCFATSSAVNSCVLGLEDEGALAASAAFVEVSSEAAAEAGVEDEGAGEEEEAEEEAGAGEEDEDELSHEKVRLTFDWLGSIVMVVLKGAPR